MAVTVDSGRLLADAERAQGHHQEDARWRRIVQLAEAHDEEGLRDQLGAPSTAPAIIAPGSPERPKLAEAAYHGVAGEVVRKIEPHTEADPAAILVQLHAAAGSQMGRGVWFPVEADRHHANLFVAVVGDTSKGRKGTSEGQVRRIADMVDPGWKERIESGLSSGEGLINAVRDPVTRVRRRQGASEETTDPGVVDKRLMVFEPELAVVLARQQKEGNSLSHTIRGAWDGIRLSTLVKNAPVTCAEPHISIIGHITRDELIRELDDTSVANGWANRFLWVVAARSKELPEGGAIHTVDFGQQIQQLRRALAFAKQAGPIQRDDAARTLWAERYSVLSAGQPGLLGALLGRAEAQVCRLALIYAVLDCSRAIRLEHLQAALAVWDYAEASARYVFGDALGDPVADTILRELRIAPAGLSRTDIRNLFSRNKKEQQIARALSTLLQAGLAIRSVERTGRAGHPREVWFATTNTPKTTE